MNAAITRTARFVFLSLAFIAFGFGDTLRLDDGTVIKGTWLGGDTHTIRFQVGGREQMFVLTHVEALTFEHSARSVTTSGNDTAANGRGTSPVVPASPPNTPTMPGANPGASSAVALVAGVSEGLTYINKGRSSGLKPGQTLQVFRETTVPASTDETGKPLKRQQSVCTLTLAEVDADSSNGKCSGAPSVRLDFAELPGLTDGLRPPAQWREESALPSPAPPLAVSQVGADLAKPYGVSLNQVWVDLLDCMSAGSYDRAAPGGPCAALAYQALEALRHPVGADWTSTVSPVLKQIDSIGLEGYIRQNGGVQALLRQTRSDLDAEIRKASNTRSDPQDPVAIAKQVSASCDVSGEQSDRCADAYLVYALGAGSLPENRGLPGGQLSLITEPISLKALRIRRNGPHTDRSLALALEVEGRALKEIHLLANSIPPISRPSSPPDDSKELLDQALSLREKSVRDLSAAQSQINDDQPVQRVGPGGTPPNLISRIDPAMPDATRQLHLPVCLVRLSLVVERDGRPSSVSLVQSCGFGRDEAAAEAVLKWRFRPGMKDGAPVRIKSVAEVTFK